uniref:Uncharacterized protein n=1 Tax=Chromera velia CCMP2878 TaxID=1169474 RepID=A0A0G4FFW2_9ALVE|eukprot:Cvel_16773.t1-p1 / transcript=Cvel_16773.t1 / gene=Cvel_16773 / organism=Chromera_velia_CCMP2878 / gene_product=hypothetical protein / transcript_product=hypothetical protein / location=Cvel_scaffold1308:41308-45664(-) / protein_length=164 / sequence_SO=supercontig / SO=protein_coding / is_pseudo=false
MAALQAYGETKGVFLYLNAAGGPVQADPDMLEVFAGHEGEFSLGARKLKFLLSSLPSRPSSLETLTCGPGVCTPSSLSVLAAFLKRGGGGEGGVTAEAGMACSLKTLIASKCEMDDSDLFFWSLPPSLEALHIGGSSDETVIIFWEALPCSLLLPVRGSLHSCL